MLWDGNSLLIGDLGGAKKFIDLVPLDRYPTAAEDFVGVHTSGYLSEKVFSKIDTVLTVNKSLYEQLEPEKKKTFLIRLIDQQIAPLLRQNDEFALGISLFMCLRGKMPPFLKLESEYPFSSVKNEDIQKMNQVMSTDFSKRAQRIITSFIKAPYKELHVMHW